MLGLDEELNLVYILNKKDDLSFWKRLGLSQSNHRAIFVDKKIYSNVSGGLVSPKSDLYIAKGDIDLNWLKSNNFIIKDSEKPNHLKHVDGYGISVKLINSNQYTITKMTPKTFKEIFGISEIGAGASIYCKKINEISKNIDVVKGWNTDIDSFSLFFQKKGINISTNDFYKPDTKSLMLFSEIKRISNGEISLMIDTDDEISNYIFSGLGAFEEPYCSSWLYHHGDLTNNTVIPYSVTTGSGRSKGIYTIVIKPTK